MKLLKSAASAFLMYSRIPVPNVEWTEENRRYSLCFFPLIGAVCGVMFFLWQYLCICMDIGAFLRGAVSLLIPVVITGGIHLDGYCDTVDAKSSYGSREKKLGILSDSHIGAFAAIYLGVYLILLAALYSEIKTIEAVFSLSCCFILSRAMSGLAAITFKNAKKEGTLAAFSKPAHKKCTVAVLVIIIAVIIAAVFFADPLTACITAAAQALLFVYYRYFSYRNFGGITGDTEGWFLQMSEIISAIAVIFSEKLTEVL